MASAADRNRLVETIVSSRLDNAARNGLPQGVPPLVQAALDKLFDTSAYGYREVVLTCVAAWEAGIDFDPRANFYECNPRSIFEKGVRPALLAHGIPHMKSGPLNVAKSIKSLNVEWAKGKKFEFAALAAVALLEWMLESPKEHKARRAMVFDLMAARLLGEAKRLESYAAAPREDMTLPETHALLTRFIAQAPDAGNTPQKIVGLTLHELHRSSDRTVFDGGKACETNLTAKKPADAWVENADGSILNLYEITVKPIDMNRIDDSVDSVLAHGKGQNEVVWLCRMPSDAKPLTLSDARTLEHKGVRNAFVDLSDWLLAALEIIGAHGRSRLLAAVTGYVAEASTSENTKRVWRALHAD